MCVSVAAARLASEVMRCSRSGTVRGEGWRDRVPMATSTSGYRRGWREGEGRREERVWHHRSRQWMNCQQRTTWEGEREGGREGGSESGGVWGCL